jgi:hypothetical protein
MSSGLQQAEDALAKTRQFKFAGRRGEHLQHLGFQGSTVFISPIHLMSARVPNPCDVQQIGNRAILPDRFEQQVKLHPDRIAIKPQRAFWSLTVN